jgi:hypothetical protein
MAVTSQITPLRLNNQVSPSLLGVDVGFSASGNTTGIAWRVDGKVGSRLVGSGWDSRYAALPERIYFELAALDAPLVPASVETPRRGCESVFYRGPFATRCRPGMTHFGRGLELRRAGELASTQFSAVLRPEALTSMRAIPGTPMVEAFPTAFLGVLLPAETFVDSLASEKRRQKSDWLYEAVVAQGVIDRLLEHLGWIERETAVRLSEERNHDIRAAFVCLMTAGFAAAGTATVIGDEIGGWFWMPPIALWADWAVAAIKLTIAQARCRGYPDVALIQQTL